MNFFEEGPVCKNCEFCGIITHVNDFDSFEYICQLMPTPVKKFPADWCGQHEEYHIDLKSGMVYIPHICCNGFGKEELLIGERDILNKY